MSKDKKHLITKAYDTY